MALASHDMNIHNPTWNPRRQPAHLSVSLKHANPPVAREQASKVGLDLGTYPAKQRSSDKSSESMELADIKQWFDQSNKRPVGPAPGFEDSK